MENHLTVCPYCDYEPSFEEVKQPSKKVAASTVRKHVGQMHPERLDELPPGPQSIKLIEVNRLR
jgi:hypothetical protein